ncbi:MAG: glycosyltransferase, partial [Clostridia bacterium]|nr:glycosyltransferase [Clostridia bacterium]
MIGSTDLSSKIINEFNNKYPNKIIYLKKKNGGLSDARNYALPYVSGQYIGFVDSDDYVELDMFEKMYNLAITETLDLVECNFIWEYPNKTKYDVGHKYLSSKDFFLFGRVMTCNKLFKTSIVKNNNLQFPFRLRYEDIEFFYKYISFVKKSNLIKKPFYHYIQRENSIINKQNQKNEDVFNILDNIINFYKLNNLYDKYKSELEYLNIRFLLGSSFLRIIKIKDKNIRKDLLNKTLNKLYNDFPNWKKNKYVKMHKLKEK